MIKKALVGVIAVIMIAGLMPVQKSSAATIEELQALIAQLQAQLTALSGGQATTGTGYQFTRNLTLGSRGADVMELQKVLIAGGYLKLATPTQLFGPMTKAAVVAWQKAMGITPTSGYFGPISRAKLNGGGGSVVIPTDSYLKVEAAGPVAGTIPSGSIYNPVLKIKVSAGKDPVTITGLTVTRGGFISNTNVSGVSIWDEMGNRYGNIITSLTSEGKAVFSFGATPFTVPAGMSKYLTVSANIASAATNGTISFSVDSATAVTATGGTVIGTFPVAGNVMTIVDGSTSLGDVRVSSLSTVGLSQATGELAATEGNVEVGYTDQEIAKIRLAQNNSKEGVYLNKLRLWVGGSFNETTNLKNFKLVSQEGTVVATADRAYDRYVTFNLATPYFIDKGYTRDFTVKTDVADGSGNYFYVTLQDDYDVVVKGATTGASVLATDSSGAALTSSDITRTTDGWFKIKKGVATVSKASTSPSGNVAPGAANAVLARFELKSGGEALEIRKMGLQIGTTTGASALSGTITVRDMQTGATYLSLSGDTTGIQQPATSINSASLLTYQQNLSSYISVPSGQSVYLEVLGTVSQSVSSGSYTVYVGQFYAKRLSTNDYTNLATGAVQGNTLSVQDVTLSVTKDASFANTTRSTGASNVKIGQFVLRPSSADDLRINTITLDITSSSNIQNLKLMDGSTQLGTTKGTPTATGNSFSLSNYILTKDTPKTISVYADILSSGVGSVTSTVAASGISGVGVSSGKSLSSTPSGAVALQTISLSSPTLTIVADDAKPLSQIYFAGNSLREVHKIKFTAANEDLTLKKITLQLVTASSTQWTTSTLASNFGTVALYDGSTLLGTGTINSTDGTIVISGLNTTLPADTDKVVTVKVDINAQDTIVPKSVLALKVYSTSTTDMDVQSSQGTMSTGITLTSNAQSNYHLITVTAPQITSVTSGSLTGSIGTKVEIGRFTVTNPGTRAMTLASTTFAITLNAYSATSSITTFGIYDSADTSNAIDTDSTTITATSTAKTTNVTFDSFSPTQTIAANTSRTYVIYADTTGITFTNPSGQTVHPTVSMKVSGNKGYSAADTTSSPAGEELFWADGVVLYSYTTTGSGAATYSNLLGSDSGEVFGPTYTY